MDGHGYLIISNSKSADAGLIPSLVGVETVNPNASDVYFDRFEFTGLSVSSLARSRWVVEGSDNDPIIGVKLNGGKSFYIPLSELNETADSDTLQLVGALSKQRRYA